jgi:hypothetical protein
MVLKDGIPEATTFAWRQAQVTFDEAHCAVASIIDEEEGEWVPAGRPAFGEFVQTRYQSERQRDAIFPKPLASSPEAQTYRFSCCRNSNGVAVQTDGERWGFRFATHWFFHSQHPWLDVTYYLSDGWSEGAQTVQFCFPLELNNPTYRYDTAGAVLVAGAVEKGGDDLPGANPELFAAQTFAAANDNRRGAILLTPDAYLVQFGPEAVRAPGYQTQYRPAQITSLPMMNLTRNDWQFGQGGQRQWTFRYRLIFTHGRYDPLRPIREAQHFGVPPYLQVPHGDESLGRSVALPEFEALNVSFEGGPVASCKVAEDGKRLILRFWNLLDSPAESQVTLPPGFARADLCDALERPKQHLAVRRGSVDFTVEAYGLLTIALCPSVMGQ